MLDSALPSFLQHPPTGSSDYIIGHALVGGHETAANLTDDLDVGGNHNCADLVGSLSFAVLAGHIKKFTCTKPLATGTHATPTNGCTDTATRVVSYCSDTANNPFESRGPIDELVRSDTGRCSASTFDLRLRNRLVKCE